jgi:hypothetical protein
MNINDNKHKTWYVHKTQKQYLAYYLTDLEARQQILNFGAKLQTPWSDH